MKDDLYRRHLKKESISIRQSSHYSFGSIQEELDWALKGDRDSRYTPISTPYGTAYNFDYAGSTTVTKQPHGDFKSDYPYFRHRFLTKGALFVGGELRSPLPYPPYIYTRNTCYWGNLVEAVWSGGMSSTLPFLNSIKTEAQYALTEKVLDGLPSWDILTDLAELKETMGFLKEGVGRLTDIVKGCLLRQPTTVLKAFRVQPTKRRVRRVKRVIDRNRFLLGNTSRAATKSAADLWLSYRYGLMPLLYSCEDAINAFHTGEIRYSKTFQVTFKNNQTTFRDKVEVASFSNGFLLCDVKSIGRNEFTYRLRATVDYGDAITKRLGLNLWAIPKTIWETIPFSWVIDWFFSVNSWLDKLRLDQIAGSISTLGTLKDRVIETRELANLRTADPSFVFTPKAVHGILCTAEVRTFQREIVSLNASPPGLVWGLDRFKRQLDTLSLGIQFAKNPTHKGIPK